MGRKPTHGMSRSPEYQVWRSILKRCHNPKAIDYDRYGGRGIAVCESWRLSFSDFYRDIGPRPSYLHSIERKNNELGYSPENCCWGTAHEQYRNRRSTKLIEIDGEIKISSDWARDFGLPPSVFSNRLRAGWSIDRIRSTPVMSASQSALYGWRLIREKT